MAFLCKFILLESAACVNTYYDIIALCPMNVITFFIFWITVSSGIGASDSQFFFLTSEH